MNSVPRTKDVRETKSNVLNKLKLLRGLDLVIEKFNACNIYILIFFVVSFRHFIIFPFGNEETKLIFSRQFYHPDWIPGSWVLTEPGGARLLFRQLVGFCLEYLPFEVFVVVARTLNFIFLIVPLVWLLKRLKLTNLHILLIVQLFLIRQHLFANEWIFLGFECKTISYIFIFCALISLVEDKYWYSMFCMAVSSYFHPLLGGWIFVAFSVYMVIYTKNLLIALKSATLYFLLVAPFVWYLIPEIRSSATNDGTNLNYIYIYERNAHHIGLFKSYSYFFSHHAFGVLLTNVFLMIHIFVHRKLKTQVLRKLNALNIVILTMLILSVFIAWVDMEVLKFKGIFYLKTYPFRTSSLALLLSITIMIATISEWTILKRKRVFFNFGVLILVSGLFVSFAVKSIIKLPNNIPYLDKEYEEVIQFAKKETKPNEVFLLVKDDFSKPQYISFMRRAQRENFVVPKFVPSHSEKLLEWKKRCGLLYKASTGTENILAIAKEYSLDYLITKREINSPLFLLKFSNSSYHIYQILI